MTEQQTQYDWDKLFKRWKPFGKNEIISKVGLKPRNPFAGYFYIYDDETIVRTVCTSKFQWLEGLASGEVESLRIYIRGRIIRKIPVVSSDSTKGDDNNG